MKSSIWLMEVQALLICSTSNAFIGCGEESGGVNAVKKQQLAWQLAPAIMLALCQPLEPASAAPFTESPILPFSSASKVTSYPAFNMPETDAFKLLRREPRLTGAVKELKDQQDMQDSRLGACEEKGKFWEQCFMYGQSEDGVDIIVDAKERGRMDPQLISPVSSFNPSSGTAKIPTW